MEVHVLCFYLCVFARALTVTECVDPLFEQLLHEENLVDAECNAAVRAARDGDKLTRTDPTPKLKGHWISQGCEQVDGPQYIIRSIKFGNRFEFKYFVFHYKDASCAHPLLGVKYEGKLYKPKQQMSPYKDVSRMLVAMQKVTVAPYHDMRSTDYSSLWNDTCFSAAHHQWKHPNEYIVFKEKQSKGVCEKSLKEFGFLKTQITLSDGRKTRELLTTEIGKIVSFSSDRVLFNPPLMLPSQRHQCSQACHKISSGTLRSPPHLEPVEKLPLLLSGEWVSEKCEPLVKELYLSRKAIFKPEKNEWKMVADYFSDAACSKPEYRVSASGTYSAKEEESSDKDSELDLKVFNARLVNKNTRETFQNACESSPFCPSKVIKTIAKFSLDRQGNPLLYLGAYAENGKRSTSFNPPLLQCSM